MERTMAYLVEFSNGGKRLYDSQEKAFDAGIGYFSNMLRKGLITRDEYICWTIEFLFSMLNGDNFECDPFVRVTIMEVQ